MKFKHRIHLKDQFKSDFLFLIPFQMRKKETEPCDTNPISNDSNLENTKMMTTTTNNNNTGHQTKQTIATHDSTTQTICKQDLFAMVSELNFWCIHAQAWKHLEWKMNVINLWRLKPSNFEVISIRQRNKLFRYSPSQKYTVKIDLVMHYILKWREVSCEKG